MAVHKIHVVLLQLYNVLKAQSSGAAHLDRQAACHCEVWQGWYAVAVG